jgi:hypothetical protein
MGRQNFLNDEPWDEAHGDKQIRTRMFERPLGAMLGASLYELLPGSPVSRCTCTTAPRRCSFRQRHADAPQREDRGAAFAGRRRVLPRGHRRAPYVHEPDQRARATSRDLAGRFPDVLAYPEQGNAWVATRDPEFPAPEVGDKGIIARFELPAEE